MKILVTGGNGLVGRSVCAELVEAGHTVTSLDMATPSRPHQAGDHQTYVAGDFRDSSLVGGLLADHDRVIHLAAVILDASARHPVDAVETNALATAKLFEMCVKAGIQRVCYTSTQAVFGAPEHYPVHPIEVDAPYAPSTLYGATKVMCEALGRHYRESGLLDTIGIRPWFVYGPGRTTGLTGELNALITNAAFGRKVQLSARYPHDLLLQPIYVKDIARALRLAVEANGGRHSVLNAPTRDRVTVAQFCHEIKSAVGNFEFEGSNVPSGLDRPLRFPPMEVESAFEQLGFHQRYNLHDGIADMVSNLRNHPEEA